MVSLIAGGLMTTFAGVRYTSGAIAQDEARREWERIEARSTVERQIASARRGPLAIAPGKPVARIVIPKVGLDEIVLEGVDDDALNGGPGHLPGTPLPGDTGNSVISAHRDRHFRPLGKVEVGDTVVTESITGATVHWLVVRRQIVDKDAPVLFPSRDERLTLTTCWPIQYFGTAPERLILTAQKIQ